MRGGEPQIDWLVLTAANRAQARGYRAQLTARAADGRLANVHHWLVVPDPGDRRVGSGGSTFVVLYELAKRLQRQKPDARSMSALFTDQRILVIHSGGDSRRLPAYAAEGKVFAPVPRPGTDGRPTTMFDLVLADLGGLASPGRVVIAAGDVLLGIGKHRPDLSAPGMVGAAFWGTLEQAGRHGVYVEGRGGSVADFLQKPDATTARQRGAVRNGKALIDTGVVSLDARTASDWLGACGVRIDTHEVVPGTGVLANVLSGRARAVDLYQHVLMAAGSKAGVASPSGTAEDRRSLSTIQRMAKRTPFRVVVTPPCDFLHIGSTREMVGLVAGRGALATPQSGTTAVYNSVISAAMRSRGPAVVESSRVERPLRLDGGNMLVGFPGGTPLHLKRGWGLACLPIGRRDWACVFFHDSHDFKTPVDRPTTTMRFDGDGERSMWTARLWEVGKLSRVLKRAMWVMDSPDRWRDNWPARDGRSLRELITKVNHGRLLEHRAVLNRETRAESLIVQLTHGKPGPVTELIEAIDSRRDVQRLSIALGRGLRIAKSHFDRARLYRSAAAITERFPDAEPIVGGIKGRDLDLAAFGCVADGVIRRNLFMPRHPPRAAVPVGRTVRVESPVRIDLAGGWSDTPPICHEMGGQVVNMAVTLDGARPIRVTAKVTPDLCIRIDSKDLNRSAVIRDAKHASEFSDPHDWGALPKAALALAGITPMSGSVGLSTWLKRFGGGLHVSMSAAVPKGSGLGTSSILSAAILACLDRVCGVRSSAASLMERTSVLEQMMSTAGGWQDQAGGITPGIKLASTNAGINQVPRVRAIKVPPAAMAELKARSLLLYTGRRRLARDILHGVVRRYLNQDPVMIQIIEDLKETARKMERDLRRGDIDEFGRGVLRYWELKKAIDPGSTNETIEAMLRPLTPHLTGYELAGAGGGGFIYMVARSTRDAATLRGRLTRKPPLLGARLHEFDIDAGGLTVHVE